MADAARCTDRVLPSVIDRSIRRLAQCLAPQRGVKRALIEASLSGSNSSPAGRIWIVRHNCANSLPAPTASIERIRLIEGALSGNAAFCAVVIVVDDVAVAVVVVA